MLATSALRRCRLPALGLLVLLLPGCLFAVGQKNWDYDQDDDHLMYVGWDNNDENDASLHRRVDELEQRVQQLELSWQAMQPHQHGAPGTPPPPPGPTPR